MSEDASDSASEKLCLDQFLKLHGIVGSGGQAKVVIQGGQVQVNGQVETRRRRKLLPGDTVAFAGQSWIVESP